MGPVGGAGIGVGLDCGGNGETGCLKAQRQASGPGEEVDGLERPPLGGHQRGRVAQVIGTGAILAPGSPVRNDP
jgi:hypothetical protein